MVDTDVFHLEDVRHDLGVDLHVLGQQNPPPFEIHPLFLPEQIHFIPARNPFEGLDDLVGKQRFGEEVFHADAFGLLVDIVPVISRQDDDGALAPELAADFGRGLQSVHPRHDPVHQHQVIRILLLMLHLQHAQRLFPAGADVCTDADLAEHGLGMLGRDPVVVHHQHVQGARIHSALRTALALIAVLQCNRDGKFRSDALFGFHADGPVHHLNDPFRDG